MTEKALDFAHLSNLKFIEELYEQYKRGEAPLDSSWRNFFEGMELGIGMQRPVSSQGVCKEDLQVYLLIQSYRLKGHLCASFNPLSEASVEDPQLSITSFGFSSSDLSKVFPTFGIMAKKEATLSEIVAALKTLYTAKVGIEYPSTLDSEIARYMLSRIEPVKDSALSREEKISIFDDLCRAELFETFLHTRYVGQKRFSLEGAESLIPLLSSLLNRAHSLGVGHAVLGMAHRGRLNVLANILGKSYEDIFYEFEDHYSPQLGEGTGDVKYHKGYEGQLDMADGSNLFVTLCANPSHLESVDPVVEGRAKGVQDAAQGSVKSVLPLLIHGDASVAGQGVVYETLQLSRIEGYSTGGTIHIVVNNQIGFTTLPKESRSTTYCTDIGRGFSAPIFHVSAEDPQSCATIARLAVELRERFGCDVFIDLCCYRKYGHNEGDEPSFTQPLLYEVIRAKKSIRTLFAQQLINEGVLSKASVEEKEKELKAALQAALDKIPARGADVCHEEYYRQDEKISSTPPSFSVKDLIALSTEYCSVPNDMRLHPKVQRLFADRLAMISKGSGEASIDWGCAEMLCFATLLSEGVDLRLSGQDCQRGTFSQRHVVWIDQKSGNKYYPLSHMKSAKGHMTALNSPLSEYAVLGFELGYSLSRSSCLTMWEAQYGDFANTAQVIIDQFISSLEQKWGQTTSLTMLLPHGYEGQGPEHSSARLERYLQLCAQCNLIIAVCSTPAQYFHLLRRQAHLKKKHPLIVFTPKALLRHPKCLSTPQEFERGSFVEVITDAAITNARKVLFCTGKIYYDLIAERERLGCVDVAIIRIEQLYPFPKEDIAKELQKYSMAKKVAFAQEEHENMGAWSFVQQQMLPLMPPNVILSYVGRARSAATATGSYYLHKKQQQQLMQEAFS